MQGKYEKAIEYDKSALNYADTKKQKYNCYSNIGLDFSKIVYLIIILINVGGI